MKHTHTHTVALLLLAASTSTHASAQMGIRMEREYARDTFRKSAPAVGTRAPDLCLERLDGKPWSLHNQLGKPVILIKASYT